MQKHLVILLAGLFTTLLSAQPGRIGGPVAGFVFDARSHSLRAILGIPGAATIGPALDLGSAAAAVTVSPLLDSAISIAPDGAPHVFRLSSGTATEMVYNSALGRAERVVFSPSGSAAALISGATAEIIAGLPDAPRTAASIDIGAPHPHSIAVSDDGAWLLAAGLGNVRLLGGAGVTRTLADGVRSALVAFAPQSRQAAVLTAGNPRLLEIDDAAAPGASLETVAQADPAFAAPAGLAFSADGKLVLVAAGTGRVTAFDSSGGSAGNWSCNCSPTGLTRMGSVFRLNEPGDGPLWLLDAASSTTGIVFVPAATAVAVY